MSLVLSEPLFKGYELLEAVFRAAGSGRKETGRAHVESGILARSGA